MTESLQVLNSQTRLNLVRVRSKRKFGAKTCLPGEDASDRRVAQRRANESCTIEARSPASCGLAPRDIQREDHDTSDPVRGHVAPQVEA